MFIHQMLSQLALVVDALLVPTFDTLRAIILMLAWADDLGHPDLWNCICGFYRHMIPEFIGNGDIPFHAEFFDAVDQIARTHNFTSINHRVDVFEPWAEQLPRCHEMQAGTEHIIQEYWERTPRWLVGYAASAPQDDIREI
jgi:hypothetical protein